MSTVRLASLVAAVAVAAQFTSAWAGFALDDFDAILENPVVRGEAPATQAFALDFWGRPASKGVGTWRPLPVLTFASDWRLGSGSPLPFHLGNLLLHGLVAVAVLLVLRPIVGVPIAVAAACLIGTLAASSEAVHSIVGRADLLLALFSVLGLGAHRKPGTAWSFAAGACLAAGLLSKETALVAPAAWLAFDWLLPPKPGGRRVSWRVAFYLLVVAGVLALRIGLYGTRFEPSITRIHNPLAYADPPHRIFGAASILWTHYLPGLIDPTHRLYACSAPVCGPAGPLSLRAWLGLACCLLLAGIGLGMRRRLPALSAGLAWFAAFFLPVSNLLVASPSVYGERLLYVPAIGLGLAVGSAAHAASRRLARPALVWAFLIAWMVGNAFSSAVRGLEWGTPERLFLSAVVIEPESALVQGNAALASRNLHDPLAAVEHARRALDLHPDYPEAEALLALSLEEIGQLEEAEVRFRSLSRRTGRPEIALDFARFLARRGRRLEAAEVLRGLPAAAQRNPAVLDLLARLDGTATEPPRAASSRPAAQAGNGAPTTNSAE